jgi:hypothetical protein
MVWCGHGVDAAMRRGGGWALGWFAMGVGLGLQWLHNAIRSGYLLETAISLQLISQQRQK